MSFQIKNITDDEYFATGDIFNGFAPPAEAHNDLVVSASFLKRVYNTNLFHILKTPKPTYSADTNLAMKFGSAFHCICLEESEFQERYEVTDSHSIEDKITLNTSDYNKMLLMKSNIREKYPKMLDQKSTELAIFGELNNIKVKCKIDKLDIHQEGNNIIINVIDLKTVYYKPLSMKRGKNGERFLLKRELQNLNYDLQAYFYIELVKAWALEKYVDMNIIVKFQILTSSTDDLSCQLFNLSSDFINDGKMKFDIAFEQVSDFVEFGIDGVSESEEL